MTLLEVARIYYESGLNVLPALKAQKRPVGAWKKWTKKVPSFDEAFRPGLEFDALCVVCGAISGGLEIIDFDQQATKFDEWSKLVGDVSKFVVETTQSGGKHLAFRSDCCGKNQKLANNASGVTIETRGEGGICLIAPSPGYELISGDWQNVPVVGGNIRDRFLNAARSLDETSAKRTASLTRKGQKTPKSPQASQNPAPSCLTGPDSVADYLRDNLSIVRDALTRRGWEYLRTEGDFEYWSRPDQPVEGKPGGSLNVKEKFFHCFTSNAPPFEPSKSYSPLDVVALLDFGGDVSSAAKAFSVRRSKRIHVVDVFHEDEFPSAAPVPSPSSSAEPAPKNEPRGEASVEFPKILFQCEGILQEIQDEANKLAIRPQPEGAFLGALCCVSHIAGRSIALNYNGNLVMPNVYGLFLAPSGMGKDAIRRVASAVASAYAPNAPLPESFASVQALQNMIATRKKVFWLHDEFGRDLAVMTGARTNTNVSSVITESLKLFSNANNRRYLPKLIAQEAKNVKAPDPVDRPCLTIFATGNPREYFDATSDALLRNGYVARFTTVCGRLYSETKNLTFEEAADAEPFQLPKGLAARVRQTKLFEESAEKDPFIAPFTREAFDDVKEYSAETERELRIEILNGDGTAEIKARFLEKIWKYALDFSVDRFGLSPRACVDRRCTERAIALVDYEKRLFDANSDKFAQSSLSKYAFDVLEWAQAVGGSFTKTNYTRKFFRRGTKREREEVLETLIDADYINESESGRYHLKR